MLSKKIVVLTDTYIYTHNCIFLTHFSLIEAELDHKGNIFETRLTQQHYFEEFSSNLNVSRVWH